MTLPTVLVVAVALIDTDGRVLIAQRPEGKQLAGLWEFPGGKVEPGEDPMATVVRECREECGIELEVKDILDVTFHAYPQKDVLLLFYVCGFQHGPQPVQHLGVADHVWARPDELRKHPLPPPDERVLSKIEAGALDRFR